MVNSGFDDSKSVILTRIRRSRISAYFPESKPGLLREGWLTPPDKIDYPAVTGDALLSRFIKELEALGVGNFVETNAENVRQRIKLLLHGKSILSWDEQYLPYNAGDTLKNERVVYENENTIVQAQAEIGLTGCDAALAETGSLILLRKKGKPGAASLLPFVHVAVVKRSAIYFSMGEFYEKKREELLDAPYVNIITGPSRTADIELTLTLGVHGPGKVIVVIGP